MAVDPLGAAQQHVEQKAASCNTSIFQHEPLTTWIVGFVELKADRGSLLTWDEIEIRMEEAAAEAAKPGSKILVNKTGGRAKRERATTKEEREVCARYAASPPRKRAIQTYIRTHYKQLYLRLKGTANGRGQGTRRDETA